MAYIGRGIDNISQIEVLDLITFTNSAGPYNILKDAVAFIPSTVNSLLIEVDGIIQAPASYTVDGSTITFGVSMPSTSTMNSMIHFGTGLITTPADGSVTAAKIATDAVETAKIKDLNVTNAKIAASTIDVTSKITGVVPTANLGSGTASSSTYLAGDQTYKTITEYDDNQLQSNVAMLGFKVAVNGSLTRYNLVDQSIDEFYDTSGVDASASTNEQRVASGSNFYYDGGVAGTGNASGATSTDTSVSGYKIEVLSAASGSLVIPGTGNVTILAVGGGGSGGSNFGGGAGGGGLIYKATHAVTAQTYDWVRGAGGAANTAGTGNNGADSTFGPNGGTVEFTAKGGGGGGAGGGTPPLSNGAAGGSGGGGGYLTTSLGGSESQTGQSGDSGTYGFGNDGGHGFEGSPFTANVGGGGGAGSVGANATQSVSGNGGTGKDYSSIFGTAVGDSGWFASGGGGGYTSYASSQAGSASAGGGTGGGTPSGGDSAAATALTGGGSGGGADGSGESGAGGTGIILVKYPDDGFSTITIADLTLQSTDVTAVAEPDFGEFVTLIENAYGTATLNTDIKGYISRDSGTTFTQGTLVDEGTWGTNKKVLGFHDLDISAQPSGTSMCYKITTHNQSASSKETRVYATSIGWR